MLELGLFWLGTVLLLVALLMLFWDAFKQNKIWGIAGLIILIPLLAHIIIAWSSLTVRKAAYTLIVGVATILVSIAGGALAQLPFVPEHEVVQTLEESIAPPKEEPLPNEEQAQAVSDPNEDYDPLLTGSEFEEVDVKEIVPPSAATVVRTPAPNFKTVESGQLASIIDKHVRLTMKDGKIVEGVLTHLEDHAITVESLVEGGSLGLSYNLQDISLMEVRLAAGEKIEALDETVQQTTEDTTDNLPLLPEVEADVAQPITTAPIQGSDLQTDDVDKAMPENLPEDLQLNADDQQSNTVE